MLSIWLSVKFSRECTQNSEIKNFSVGLNLLEIKTSLVCNDACCPSLLNEFYLNETAAVPL